jgi:hypothetical protein
MTGTKRKSDGPVTVASKRARSGPTSSTPTYMDEEEITDLSRDELVEHVLGLQQQLKDALAAVPKAKEFTPNELAEKSSKARQMLVKGIEKQMKVSRDSVATCPDPHADIIQWTPSCKPGKARFVYEGHIEHRRVFRAMLKLPDSHEKKMFKVSANDFEHDIGQPRGRVRYADLRITSSDVNIRWTPEENVFKVSGTYGV